jgi:hypothetical protein
MWQLRPGFISSRSALGGGASLSAFSLDYVTAAVDTSFQSTFSFASQSLGAAASGSDTRYTIVAAGSNAGGGQLITGVTVGGISATSVVASASSSISTLWIVDTTSLGTSATIAVSVDSGGATGCAIGVYRMINPGSSTASATANAAHTGGVSTATLTIPTGGLAVASVYALHVGTATTFTWTGTSTPSEKYDQAIGANAANSGAESTAVGSNLTFIATAVDTSPTNQHIAAASWGP